MNFYRLCHLLLSVTIIKSLNNKITGFSEPWVPDFSSATVSSAGMLSVAAESFDASTSPNASGSKVVFFFFFFFKLGSNISYYTSKHHNYMLRIGYSCLECCVSPSKTDSFRSAIGFRLAINYP